MTEEPFVLEIIKTSLVYGKDLLSGMVARE